MGFFATIIIIAGITFYFDRRARAQEEVMELLRDKTIEGFMCLHTEMRTLVDHLARIEIINVKYEKDRDGY